jgi:hypothetical protein
MPDYWGCSVKREAQEEKGTPPRVGKVAKHSRDSSCSESTLAAVKAASEDGSSSPNPNSGAHARCCATRI